MNIKEKRERIKNYLRAWGIGDGVPSDRSIENLLRYLASEGVVIKGDDELPKIPEFAYDGEDRIILQLGAAVYRNLVIDRFKAYPLIEVEQMEHPQSKNI